MTQNVKQTLLANKMEFGGDKQERKYEEGYKCDKSNCRRYQNTTNNLVRSSKMYERKETTKKSIGKDTNKKKKTKTYISIMD